MGRTFKLNIGHICIEKYIYNWIPDWLENRKKKRQLYKERLATSISDIKYLDKVVLVDGCTYSITTYKHGVTKTINFKSFEDTLKYCRRIPINKLLKIYGNSINIYIHNPNAPENICGEQIPSGLLVKNCKDALCVLAQYRTITIASDLSEIYVERFDFDRDGFCYPHVFDYGILYGNYPVYRGKELCLSSSTAGRYNFDFNKGSLFIPELTGDLEKPNAEYNCLQCAEMAYRCWFVNLCDDGSVFDDDDGGSRLDQ